MNTPTIPVCPKCSADLRAVGRPGYCWYCKQSLPAGISGVVAEAVVDTMPVPPKPWAIRRLIGLLLVFFVLAFTKGLYISTALRSLLFTIPAVLAARGVVASFIARNLSPRRVKAWAWAQASGFAAWYLLLPMDFNDGAPYFLGQRIRNDRDYMTLIYGAELGALLAKIFTLALVCEYLYVRAKKRSS